MNKKILATMLTVVMTISSSISAFGVPSITHSNNESEQGIELNNSRLNYDEIENKIKNIESKIDELNRQIEPLQIITEKNKKDIENITMVMDNTNKEIIQYRKDISELDSALGQRVKAMYVSGKSEFNYLTFVLEAESTSDLFTRIQAVSKVVGKDKLAIENIYTKKKELDTKINGLKEEKKEIDRLNEDVEDTLSKLTKKKKEQEVLIDQAKKEKSNFDSDYLSGLERNAVSYQFNIIDNSDSSSEEILAAMNQLIRIRDNQVKSQIVIEEINQKIQQAQIAAEANKGKVKSGLSVPAAKAQGILNEAYKHIGKEYVWGATGEDTFDCSGFTQYVYKHAVGIDISRTTYTQIDAGQPVSKEQLQPGDLVFPHAGHVGIYVGNGQMIHAPHTGEVIKVGPVYDFYTARRVL